MRDAKEGLHALYETERVRLLTLPDTAPLGAYDSPVFGEGNPNPVLLLIGEAPGAEETNQGRPFVGKAGKQLSALLELAGITREEIYITNAVKYRPVTAGARGFRNRTPGPEEIRAGLPLLREEILLLRPKVIGTLGNVPLSALLALFGLRKATVGACHGRIMEAALEGISVSIYPMYHPASTIYNRALVSVLEEEAIRLGTLL